MGKVFKTSSFELLCWSGSALSMSAAEHLSPRDTPEKCEETLLEVIGVLLLFAFGGA